MLEFVKKIFKENKINFKTLVANGALIVDVRSEGEFKMGHINDAINIPLNEIKTIVTELKRMNKPIITCCKSGVRSKVAASQLSSMGLEAYNGGAWYALEKAI
jgi:phage shock protein E